MGLIRDPSTGDPQTPRRRQAQDAPKFVPVEVSGLVSSPGLTEKSLVNDSASLSYFQTSAKYRGEVVGELLT